MNTSTGFTPYELLTGRQFPGPGAGLDLLEAKGELAHQPYYDQLSALVSSFSKQVQEKRGTAQDPVKAFTADWVWVKAIKRKWTGPRWTGPFKVIERTSHATTGACVLLLQNTVVRCRSWWRRASRASELFVIATNVRVRKRGLRLGQE